MDLLDIVIKSGVGLINGAMATTIAIEKFNPFLIINEGVVGGYTNDLHTGMIVACIDAINITSLEYIGPIFFMQNFIIRNHLYSE